MTNAKPNMLRYLRLHAGAYALGAVIFFLVDLAVADGSWFLWPVLVWGALLFLHYIYVQSRRVDNDWAERRAAEVAERAYDLSHIEDIQRRYGGGSLSRRDGNKRETD